MKKYIIQLNENQMRLIAKAVEFFSRSFSGQLELDHIVIDGEGMSFNDRRMIEVLYKHFLGIHHQGILGIHNESIPNDARTAWDICKVLRHQLWLDSDRKFRGVDSEPPAKYGEELLINVNPLSEKKDDKKYEYCEFFKSKKAGETFKLKNEEFIKIDDITAVKVADVYMFDEESNVLTKD